MSSSNEVRGTIISRKSLIEESKAFKKVIVKHDELILFLYSFRALRTGYSQASLDYYLDYDDEQL